MEHWGNALAALVDDEGNLKGTGFVCNAGFLITCAHVLEDAGGVGSLEDAGGVGSRVTAIFDVGKNRHQLPFRIAPGGWFPRHAPRLCDEPDELCDVAILMPIDSGVSPVLGPAIATPSPVSGNVVLTGYFPVSNGDRRKETIRAVLQPGRDEPGWLRAKPPDPWSNAPIGGMSGSPAFPDSYEGVVGMLAEGQEEGRGLWLLIPAEVLTRAISIVVQQRGAQPAGRKLWLRQTVAKDAVDRYATCELSSSRQRHQPGEPLSVDFEAYASGEGRG